MSRQHFLSSRSVNGPGAGAVMPLRICLRLRARRTFTRHPSDVTLTFPVWGDGAMHILANQTRLLLTLEEDPEPIFRCSPKTPRETFSALRAQGLRPAKDGRQW